MAVNDAVLELLFRHDANVAQDRAGQAFEHVQPRTVFERESEFEASCRLLGELGIGFLADMRGMIVGEIQRTRGCHADPWSGIEVPGQRSMPAAD